MLVLAIILFILWFFGYLAFHVTTGLIHILLIIALVLWIVDLINRNRSRPR